MMTPPTIVIIEDDPAILMVLEMMLQRAGYTTIGWMTGTDAHQLIQQAQPDLVILDLTLEHPHAGEMVLGRMGWIRRPKRSPSLRVLAIRSSCGTRPTASSVKTGRECPQIAGLKCPLNAESNVRQSSLCGGRPHPLSGSSDAASASGDGRKAMATSSSRARVTLLERPRYTLRSCPPLRR